MQFLIFAAVLALASATALPQAPASYKDFSEVVAITDSSEKVGQFLDCFSGKTPCTDSYQYFKSIVPDFIGNACSKCTAQQMVQIRTVLEACHKFYPELSKSLEAQLDPEAKLFRELHAVIDVAKA